MNHKWLILNVITALTLTSCATPPTYKVSGGCGINAFNKPWLDKNVTSMKWSGPCVKGLAEGVGTLTATTVDGFPFMYEGRMVNGFQYTFGNEVAEYTIGNDVYKGKFDTSGFIYGQRIKNGILATDGHVKSGVFLSGKMYFTNGQYADGTYLEAATGYSSHGKGIASATVYNADGSEAHWIYNQQVYTSKAKWRSLVQSAQLAETKRLRQLQLEREEESRVNSEAQSISTPPDVRPSATYAAMDCPALYRELHNVSVRHTYLKLQAESESRSAERSAAMGSTLALGNILMGSAKSEETVNSLSDTFNASAAHSSAKSTVFNNEKVGLMQRAAMMKELISASDCER